jgi:hypothetical protein
MGEAAVLHPSHHWGQRPIFEREAPGSNRFRERKIPCCLNCLTDGYEDEYDAFQPCRRPEARDA